MALSQDQLYSLFQAINSGNQGAFAGMTPDMSQDERNQWINSYGTGGTNYGQYLDWYRNGRPGINKTGSWSATGPNPYMNTQSISSPTGVSMTSGWNQTSNPYVSSAPQNNQSDIGTPPTAPVNTNNVTRTGTGITPPPAAPNSGYNGVLKNNTNNPYTTSSIDPNTGYPVGQWHQQYSPGAAGSQSPEAQFAQPMNSVGPASQGGGLTPGGSVTNPNIGNGTSNQMVRPKSYNINPMYYKGWNMGGNR